MKPLILLLTYFFLANPLFSEVKAVYNDDKVEISWASPLHIKVDYFIIERSEDGKHFIETFRVSGAEKKVEFYEIDYNPPSKIAYYRIKQVSFNGNYNYTETILVKNYNKLNYYGSYRKALKGYKGRNILIVLKNKKGKEFYVKADITEYKKELYAMPDVNLKVDTYLIIAASDDTLLNKKITIIGRSESDDSFYTQNTK